MKIKWLHRNSRKEVFRPQACNFIKKETLAQAFSCEVCEICKNAFYYRTPLVAASDYILLIVLWVTTLISIRGYVAVTFYCRQNNVFLRNNIAKRKKSIRREETHLCSKSTIKILWICKLTSQTLLCYFYWLFWEDWKIVLSF